MWSRKWPPLRGLRCIRCLGAISDAASLAATSSASKRPAIRPPRSRCDSSPAKGRNRWVPPWAGRLVPCGRTPAAALEPGRIDACWHRRALSRAVDLGPLSLAYHCRRLVIIVRSVLIAALILQRRRRRVAEVERRAKTEALGESEARFRTMADIAPVLMWMSDTRKLCTFFNKSWLDFTGRTLDQELGNGWVEGVHADDRERCLATSRTPSMRDKSSRWSTACEGMTASIAGFTTRAYPGGRRKGRFWGTWDARTTSPH